MRIRRALTAAVLLAVAALPGMLAADPVSAAAPDLTCPANIVPGHALTTPPWPATQLDLTDLSRINQGLYARSGQFGGQSFPAGSPVKVAVIDSGLISNNVTSSGVTRPNPLFEGADIPARPHKVQNWRFDDCVGHGTAVSSLIIAQPSGHSLLMGIAPRVQLIPIQYTNADDGGTTANLAAALAYAIAQHPRVINMSLQLPNKPLQPVIDQLARARQQGIVIVAAGGNDNGQDSGKVYPAAFSPVLNNIIAVSAVAQDGSAPSFGITGHYIDVAAPGVNVPAALRYSGVDPKESGTSFAAPFVTGTVALMLAMNPTMTPAAVRNRLEATADPPPGDQPNSTYGWGMIDPLQAVTSQRNDVIATPMSKPGRPLAAPRAAAVPNRSLGHRAIAIAVVLLGLAALAVTGAAILRGNRRAHPGRT